MNVWFKIFNVIESEKIAGLRHATKPRDTGSALLQNT